MRHLASLVLVLLTFSGTTSACGDDDGTAATVLVLAAASLIDVFEEIATSFEAINEGATVELSFGASSALREQILSGAPADVFAAASDAPMAEVVDAGAVTGGPSRFAGNQLVIVVPSGNPGGVTGLADFADAGLLIGLCAEEAPCGQYGREALANAGVTPAQDTDEPDARALLTKVSEGELDAGLVYTTDVLAAGDAVEAIEIPSDVNIVASYPIAALAEAPEPPLAAAFVAFVLSDEGQAILAEHGFLGP